MLKFFENLFGKKLYAPMTGEVIALDQVPDAVFAEKMVGEGVAIVPTSGTVVAPCDGKIAQIFPTKHAIGIEGDGGVDLLIHVGIDTVELKGEGFTALVEEGQHVKAGTPLLEVDLEKIKAAGKSTTTPFVVTNTDQITIKSEVKGQATQAKSVVMKLKVNK